MAVDYSDVRVKMRKISEPFQDFGFFLFQDGGCGKTIHSVYLRSHGWGKQKHAQEGPIFGGLWFRSLFDCVVRYNAAGCLA